jgi:hypothetical protein
MLVCSSADGLEWFVHSDGTKPLRPKRPSPETYAHDVLSGSEEEASGDVLASAWFDHPIAERYQVHEHFHTVHGRNIALHHFDLRDGIIAPCPRTRK